MKHSKEFESFLEMMKTYEKKAAGLGHQKAAEQIKQWRETAVIAVDTAVKTS